MEWKFTAILAVVVILFVMDIVSLVTVIRQSKQEPVPATIIKIRGSMKGESVKLEDGSRQQGRVSRVTVEYTDSTGNLKRKKGKFPVTTQKVGDEISILTLPSSGGYLLSGYETKACWMHLFAVIANILVVAFVVFWASL